MGYRGSLWLRRSRSQRGLLLVLASAIAVVTIILSAIVGLAARTPAAAVRDTLRSSPFSATAAVLGMDLTDAPSRQDAQVASLLRSRFGSAPLTTARTVVSDTWPLADGSPGTSPTTDSPTVEFVEDDAAVRSRVRASSGSITGLDAVTKGDAGSPAPIAIDATGARALGVEVGDEIRLQLDSRVLAVRVQGVFAATHPADLAWVAAAPGVDGSSARLLAGAELIDALGSSPTVRYAIAPRADDAAPADLPAYASGFRSLAAATEKTRAFAGLESSVTGSGLAIITSMEDSLRATSTVIPVPIAVLAVSSLIALILLAQLLATSRENETRLLRARGASLGMLARVALVETTVIAALGVLVGVAVSQLGLAFWVGPSTSGLDAVVPALATLVVAIACGVGVAFRAALRASGAPRPDSGRVATAGSASLAILLTALAAIMVWRFLSTGVPGPGQPADPVGAFAPAAALCALAVLALVAIGPLARAFERVANRSTGVGAVLPARQLGRNLGLFAAPAALLVLAVGAASFASVYAGSWATFLAGSSRLVTGSDVAVDVENAPLVGAGAEFVDDPGYAKVAGVTATAPVLRMGAQVGDQTVDLVAVSASRLPSLVDVDARMFDAGAVSRMLLAGAPTGAAAGLPLPHGSSRVTLRVTTVAKAGSVSGARVSSTLWVEDAQGDLAAVTLPATPIAEAPVEGAAAPVEVAAALPAGGPWRAVALDVGIHSPSSLTGFSFTVLGVGASSGGQVAAIPLDGSDWRAASQVYGVGVNPQTKGAYLTSIALPNVAGGGLDSTIRLVPRGSARVPVVVGRDMAAVLGLRVGDPVEFDGDWSGFSGRVAGIVPSIPGAADRLAAIADLPAMQAGALRTTSEVAALTTMWIAAADPSAVEPGVSRVAGPTSTVSVASGALSARFLSSAVIGLWMGAFGSAAFALVALAGAIGATARRRAGEVTVLRAVGMSARQQGAARRTELVVIAGYALICGILSGAVVSAIAASALARLSVSFAPRVLPVPLGLDAPTLAIALVLLIVAVAGITAWFVRSVRHRAAEPALRGGE